VAGEQVTEIPEKENSAGTPTAAPFCVVFSQILGETILFCEDEHTKTALVEAGADEWSIAPKSF